MDLVKAFAEKYQKEQPPVVEIGDTTVRRISYGVGVEKVFPLHAPSIEKVELVRHGKVRRAKLYYLRGRVGKAAKVKEAL